MDHDWYICKYFQVLDRPASDPEWFKARNQMGQVAIRALSSLNSPLLAVAKTNKQVGLVPSNYLQELSQFLTQDVQGGRNGSDAPVGETFLQN